MSFRTFTIGIFAMSATTQHVKVLGAQKKRHKKMKKNPAVLFSSSFLAKTKRPLRGLKAPAGLKKKAPAGLFWALRAQPPPQNGGKEGGLRPP